jgi:transglutaminase-like putative cysteine protease
VDSLLAGAGVCRDFAHLVVALLRAVYVPARVVSVYAPGLYPMDFHAVAEAFVDGQWRVVDGTLLAPRQALVRIATVRDDADIAFLDNHKGAITLNKLVVIWPPNLHWVWGFRFGLLGRRWVGSRPHRSPGVWHTRAPQPRGGIFSSGPTLVCRGSVP